MKKIDHSSRLGCPPPPAQQPPLAGLQGHSLLSTGAGPGWREGGGGYCNVKITTFILQLLTSEMISRYLDNVLVMTELEPNDVVVNSMREDNLQGMLSKGITVTQSRPDHV